MKVLLGALLGLLVGMFVIYRVEAPSAVEPVGALASLNDREISRTYHSAFWLAQERAGNELWNRAYTYCTTPATYGDGAPRPNCTIVQLVRDPTIATQIAANESARRWIKNGADQRIHSGTDIPGAHQPGDYGLSAAAPTGKKQ